MMSHSQAHPPSRGIALVIVLWSLVLLAVIATGFAADTRTETKLAHNFAETAKAEALAEAGLHRAILELLKPAAERRLTVLDPPVRFSFGGGEILLSLEDEGGKIDLNRAPDTLLRGLLTAVGIEDQDGVRLVNAIADFRDNDEQRRADGAEDDDYRAAGLGHEAKDRPFEDIEELKQVLGMTPELFARIAPALTVHSRSRRVNRKTASPLVLQALTGVDPAAAGAPGGDPADPEIRDLGADASPPPELGGLAGRGPRTLPGSRSARFRAVTIRAEARTLGGAVFVRRAVVRLARGRARPYRIEAWKQGRLAPVARN
ncbi:MAG: hypothetical protein V3T02_03855 [Alphaproteobacteria bacterium]